MDEFVRRIDVLKILKVHYQTFYRMEKKGQIEVKRTIGGHRLYNLEKYPNYEIIKDIGSGLNMERKGLKEILELAIKGQIGEVVIAYKDRLARFGYELIEWIIKKYSNGKIKIENKKEKETPEEISKDILQIMNVYVAKINGMRKYSKKE